MTGFELLWIAALPVYLLIWKVLTRSENDA